MTFLMLSKNRISKPVNGFTLIEMLVAMLIMMVGLLGMFQAINLAMDKNLENQLRNRGVAVAEQKMYELKSYRYDQISSMRVSLRNYTTQLAPFVNISIARRQDRINDRSSQLSIRTSWRYRNRAYEHQVVSGVVNPDISGQ